MSNEERAERIGGLRMTHLPAGLGAASDFEFEWGEVRFVQRVWETEVEEGVWRVDLQVQAMRGPRITDLDALRAFLIEYHEKDDDWAALPLGDDGFGGDREAFKLVEKGTAVEVRDPFDRQGMKEVEAVLSGIGAPVR